ncbi:MAG: ATP-binding cassette domain-containing protein [Firmicutes bacterium]|nr:ATP-binding cassette domain-containing protein [Bacillota bacterium]
MKLALEGVYKSFGEKEVLKGLSFAVEAGNAMGLLGRNGAGKTTAIRIIMDIFKADGGGVTLDGEPIHKRKLKLGYLPEERGLYAKLKVSDQILFFAQLKGMSKDEAVKRQAELLKRLEAEEYRNSRLETLSKGNQQKIQLLIAVINDPDILILDEPFTGLDPVNATLLKDLIIELTAKNKVVMFSSHQMPYVEEFCRHICIINDGRAALDGNIKDIRRTYPRNRIHVSYDEKALPGPLPFSRDDLPYVSDIARKNGELTFTLKDENDRNRLMGFIAEKMSADSFAVVEPSLEEIFVDYAGGQV